MAVVITEFKRGDLETTREVSGFDSGDNRVKKRGFKKDSGGDGGDNRV